MNDGVYGITDNIYFNIYFIKIQTIVDSNFNGFSIFNFPIVRYKFDDRLKINQMTRV